MIKAFVYFRNIVPAFASSLEPCLMVEGSQNYADIGCHIFVLFCCLFLNQS